MLCLLLLVISAAQAVPAAPPRVVVVVVPGLRAEDLTRLEIPALDSLIREGASGWMVCRAGRTGANGRDSEQALALTLGSGARAVAGAEMDRLAAGDRTALQTLRQQNERLDHPVPIGALGDVIHRAGWKTASLGSTDSDQPDRPGFALVMDSASRVDVTDGPAGSLQRDASAPDGIRADVPAMLQAYDHLEPSVALVTLTFGDLARADRYAPLCFPAIAAAHRAAALRALDTFLQALRSHLGSASSSPRTLLILLSPGPAASVTEPEDRLSPILLEGADIAPGILTSTSTRRHGLALNTDFLPTVARFLGLPLPREATGRPLVSSPVPTGALSPERLRAEHDNLLRIARQQNALGGLPTVQMVLVLLSLVALLYRRVPIAARMIGIGIVALPLGMLILPVLAPGSVWAAAALLAGFTVLIAILGGRDARAARWTFFALCATLVALTLADLLTGTHLLQQAWMSYSVVEGARFYGIGNEYMGAVIGAACALIPLVEKKKRIALLAALFLALVLAMGFPGAKVGAIPSAGAAFGAALLVLWRGRLRARDVALVLLGVGLLLAAMAALDLRHAAGAQTHLARALTGAGGDTLWGIARRKLALEGYLFLHSPWSATMVVSAGALWWLRRKQPERFSGIAQEAVLAGLVCGAVASLLCNDSGVTAAALILLYGWSEKLTEVSSAFDPARLLP
ncbi:MAG TPA: hypothetical protein VFA07_10500 [Chthonomonadaceae bacterium]|nr:hypothetical protein [Chthonomonadaceae bacterium]